MKKPFYITTTIPYVNADPHMGHALEFIRTDIIARWKKLAGFEVFFNTGTDEHGQKVLQSSISAGKSPQEYCDEYSARFKKILPLLGISSDVNFLRTTDGHHVKAAQEFWSIVKANGYIAKKFYKARYCVGCEEEKTDSELTDGKCPVHPHMEIQIIEEENYFFKLSEFGGKLIQLYDSKKFMVIPDFRLNEMREFIKRGLNDFSISRLKSKMPWGVPVPDDPDHVMYVWFDALPNYITALGWPEDQKKFERFWKNGLPVQYCGKDNTRFQSIMWQAMLLAADLPPTHTVVVNGFITGDKGVKMSKSLGNVMSPVDIVNEYGTDALRYFLARETSSFEDSPFTLERFKAAYNTNLANGLGNLVSRILKMSETYLEKPVPVASLEIPEEYKDAMEGFDIQKAADFVWKYITDTDELIQKTAPFKLVKTDKVKAVEIIKDLCARLFAIASLLEPILPVAAENIKILVKENRMPSSPMFIRKE